MNAEHVLGVDVGGNHVKMGFVDPEGNIHNFNSHYTKDFVATGDFTDKLIQTIQFNLLSYSQPVTKIGIGFPGTLSKDRNYTLNIPSLPELLNAPTGQHLRAGLPECMVFLANDAKAAAMGELHFAATPPPDTFAFITLGTGIGSAYVQNRQIFVGEGNALELGHIVSRNGVVLEKNIGKQGILNLAAVRLGTWAEPTVISREKPLSATEMVVEANNGDAFCRSVFYEVGQILGEGLVALIRILDVNNILIGGGLSASWEFVRPGTENVLNAWLPPYYMDKLHMSKATLGNDAGLLGAASLCF